MGKQPQNKNSNTTKKPNFKNKGNKKFSGKGNYNNQNQPRRRKLNNLVLTFNADARKDFLTGFHKRKLERKTKYNAKLLKDLVKEKARLREETKKSIGPTSSSHSILPEVEKLIGLQSNKETNVIQSYTDGSKTVTISSIDSLIPQIPSDDESDDNEPETFTPTGPQPNVKQETNRLLRSTKAFKKAQKLKLKKTRPNPHRKPTKTSKDSSTSGDKNKKTGRARKMKSKTKGKR